MKTSTPFVALSCIMVALSAADAGPADTNRQCTYSTWVWNTRTKRSEGHTRVSKPYADLTPEEKDPHSNCTVCEEDQAAVAIDGVPTFQVCKDYADKVRGAVQQIKDAGFPITTVISY